jgi:hypothetical protein
MSRRDGMIELTVQPAARVDIRALRMREGTYDDGEDSQEGEEGEEEEEGDEEEEEDEEGEESEEGFSSHDGGRDATSGGIPGVSRPKPVEPPKPVSLPHTCRLCSSHYALATMLWPLGGGWRGRCVDC